MSGLSLADSGMVQCMVSTQFSDDTNVLQRPTVGRTAELTVLGKMCVCVCVCVCVCMCE